VGWKEKWANNMITGQQLEEDMVVVSATGGGGGEISI